jgi:hypothetical protein
LEIPGEASNFRPQASVGGRDGGVEKGDVEAQEGTDPIRKSEDPPGRRSVSRNPGRPGTNLETGGSKVRRAATSIGSVSWLPARESHDRDGGR